MILIIKLLIAHIIGDFVLQPDRWVANKKAYKHRSKYFYLHGLIHLISLLVVLQFDWSYWPSIAIIVISHLLIDLAKLNLDGKISPRILFCIDQLLHIIIIGIVAHFNEPYTIDFEKLYTAEFLLTTLALLLTSFVSSIVMKILLSRWSLEEDNADDSLKNAGKYIGILERLLVFGFIVLNQWSAIGLLVTAKSVFRFSDLSRAKDRKLTEYILIGTLMSFGLAILIGLLYKYIVRLL